MILFIGDSFTWGQGLQYYPLVETKGWTWDDCQKFVSEDKRFEQFGFDIDEFRRTNAFPYLVSKQIDLPYQTPRFENGGDNCVSYNIVENLHQFITINNIFLIVFQFSCPSRSILNGSEPKFDTMDEQIEHQIKRISDKMDEWGIDWLGISWMHEMGKILKEKYPKNFVPVKYNEKYYDCFEFGLDRYANLRNLTIQYTQNIDDGHFNLLGHQVIADSIVEKFKSRNDLVEKLDKCKKEIQNR